MKHQAINLVKFKAFCKRTKAPLCHAVGYLESLWIFAQIQARDGDLTKFTSLEIAGWIEYPGDPQELIDALVETRWLDRVGDRLLVHDWESHKPNWLKGSEARWSGANPDNELPSTEASTDTGAVPSTVLGTVPSTLPPKPKPKPNLTQPDPNPAQPFLAAARAADGRLDFSPLQGTNCIFEAAVKLNASFRKVRIVGISDDWIWAHCAIGELLKPGFISDTASKVMERKIAKPKAYIEKALCEECEAIGLQLRTAIECVPERARREAVNAM